MMMTATAHQWQERRLGRTILRTYRDTRDLYDVVPNDRQPRMGPKVDLELQRQIVRGGWIEERAGRCAQRQRGEPVAAAREG